MYCGETVEIALRAPDAGATTREAGALAGASSATVSRWAAGRLPHERASGRIRARTRIVEAPASDAGARAAYDAAMEENVLLKAVLDDLKEAGSTRATTSRRRCVELSEKLRAGTPPANSNTCLSAWHTHSAFSEGNSWAKPIFE